MVNLSQDGFPVARRQPWDPRSEKGGLEIKSWPCLVAVGDGLQSPRIQNICL